MANLTHDEFIERLAMKNRHFANHTFDVVGKYVNQKTPIQCKCNIHNCLWDESPAYLFRNRSCPECGNRYYSDIKIFGDKSNLWITHPDVARLLKNPEDGYRCSYGTMKKFEFVCPDCGNEMIKPVFYVSHQGLCCKRCSDGVSMPNKYSRALLDQLPVDFYICEYQPDWAKPYFYDNYFEYNGRKCVLEMDGAYHYFEKIQTKDSLEKRQNDDRIKDDLAQANGVEVIRIDCSVSKINVIQTNILQSRLADIFDLSSIDWVVCGEQSQKNLVKDACHLYMQHKYTLTEIRCLLQIGKDALCRYLKTGAELGWCDYDPEFHKTLPKSVIVFDETHYQIHQFNGIRETVRQMKAIYDVDLYRRTLTSACKTGKLYQGFYFELYNENNTK